ncbi:MAG: hypothetical protein WD100_07550, partial [Tistlia sp.]
MQLDAGGRLALGGGGRGFIGPQVRPEKANRGPDDRANKNSAAHREDPVQHATTPATRENGRAAHCGVPRSPPE